MSQRDKAAPSSNFKKISLVTTVVVGCLAYVCSERYQSQGAFMPWRCSVLGLDCPSDIPVRGYIDEQYRAVQDAFKDNFLWGREVGAGIAAYVDGKLVADLQAGWQDIEAGVPYTEETLQLVFSSTKVLAAIVVAQAVQNGSLSYDEMIATYWPEFAQGNKENVTLGDLMAHAAGVGHLDIPVTSAMAEDPDRFSRFLAAQPHNFGGVRTRSYHAVTSGWYINEVLKRTVNKTVDQVASELNEAYGIEWRLKPYQEEYDHRIAKLYTGPPLRRFLRGTLGFIKAYVKGINVIKVYGKDSIFYKAATLSVPDQVQAQDFTSLRMRRIESPACSGYTNARSMAKLAAMMANGGHAIEQGEPDLLEEATYATATAEPVGAEFDHLLNNHLTALKGGFTVMDPMIHVENTTFIGWAGAGGSLFVWNPELSIGFGYCDNGIFNLVAPDERSLHILSALVRRVKQLENR